MRSRRRKAGLASVPKPRVSPPGRRSFYHAVAVHYVSLAVGFFVSCVTGVLVVPSKEDNAGVNQIATPVVIPSVATPAEVASEDVEGGKKKGPGDSAVGEDRSVRGVEGAPEAPPADVTTPTTAASTRSGGVEQIDRLGEATSADARNKEALGSTSSTRAGGGPLQQISGSGTAGGASYSTGASHGQNVNSNKPRPAIAEFKSTLPLPPHIAFKYPPRIEDVLDEEVNSFAGAASKFQDGDILSSAAPGAASSAGSAPGGALSGARSLQNAYPTAQELADIQNPHLFRDATGSASSPGGSGAARTETVLSTPVQPAKLGPATERRILEQAIARNGVLFEPRDQVAPKVPQSAVFERSLVKIPDQIGSARAGAAALGSPAEVAGNFAREWAQKADLQDLPTLSIAPADQYPLLDAADPQLAAAKAAQDERVWGEQADRSADATGEDLQDDSTTPGEEGSTTTSAATGGPPTGPGAAVPSATVWDTQKLGKWVDNFAERAVALTTKAITPKITQNVEQVVRAELAKAFPPPAVAPVPTPGSGQGSSSGSFGSSGSAAANANMSVASAFSGSGSRGTGSYPVISGSSTGRLPIKEEGTEIQPSTPAVPGSKGSVVINDAPTVVVQRVVQSTPPENKIDILAYKDLYPVGSK
ncbi:unnamed protein product [Amoebophrya sp. A120]|nr:unnamed protein product [Amoebophrya sp. A120]|eukprot:GSA120T00025687001.1